MPKMKSHSGTKKRFRATGTGKLVRAKAYKSHILTKKTTKRKRGFRQETECFLPPTARRSFRASPNDEYLPVDSSVRTHEGLIRNGTREARSLTAQVSTAAPS